MYCNIKVIFLIILLGFSLSSIIIYSQRNLYIQGSCTVLEISSNFDIEKVITNLWTSTYKTGNIYLKQYCPSHNYETNLLKDNIFISRTDNSNILDCHGNKIYDMIFQNVSYFEIPNLCYSNNLNSNIIYLKDIDGNIISKINKNDEIFVTDWSVTILNTYHPGNDPRIIFSLIGELSIKQYDICNKYFWSVSWSVLTLFSLIVLFISYRIIKPKLIFFIKILLLKMIYTILLVQSVEMNDLLNDIYIYKVNAINKDEAMTILVSQANWEMIINYLSIVSYYSHLFKNFDNRIKDIILNFKIGKYDKEWYNNNIKLISELITNHIHHFLIRIE